MRSISTLKAQYSQPSKKGSEMEPKLPPELEKLIFSLAYRDNPKDVQNLICVARRVEEWLCPSIFKVVLILPTHDVPFKRFTLSTFLHYGKYIKHLAIHLGVLKPYHEDDLLTLMFRSRSDTLSNLLGKILIACPHVVKLWVYGEVFKPLTKYVRALSVSLITHLAIDLPSLLKQLPSPPGNRSWFNPNSTSTSTSTSPPLPKPMIAMFPGITHLDTGYLFDVGKENTQTRILAIHFPNLTHFAFNPQSSGAFDEGLTLMLERCTKLELVLMKLGFIGLQERWSSRKDSRVVEIHGDGYELWKRRGSGGEDDSKDMWSADAKDMRRLGG